MLGSEAIPNHTQMFAARLRLECPTTGLQMVLIPLPHQCCQRKTTLVHCALQPIYFQTRHTLTDTKTCNLAELPNMMHHLRQKASDYAK